MKLAICGVIQKRNRTPLLRRARPRRNLRVDMSADSPKAASFVCVIRQMVLPEKSSDRKNWKRKTSDRNRRNRIVLLLNRPKKKKSGES